MWNRVRDDARYVRKIPVPNSRQSAYNRPWPVIAQVSSKRTLDASAPHRSQLYAHALVLISRSPTHPKVAAADRDRA